MNMFATGTFFIEYIERTQHKNGWGRTKKKACPPGATAARINLGPHTRCGHQASTYTFLYLPIIASRFAALPAAYILLAARIPINSLQCATHL